MNVPDELKYTKDHEWVSAKGDILTIGITDFAQGELGDIVYVEVDTLDETLEAEEVFGTVEAVKTVSDLFLPVAGEIIEFNDAATPPNPTDTLYAFESGFWNMVFDSLGNIIDSTYLDADSTWLLSYFDLSAIDTAFNNTVSDTIEVGNKTYIDVDERGNILAAQSAMSNRRKTKGS